MRWITSAIVATTVLTAATASAAGDPAAEVALEIRRLSEAIRAIRAEPSLDQDDRLAATIAFASRRQRFFLVYAALRKQWGLVVTPADVASAREPELAAVEQARTDVQPGATNSASGTSSLVSKGSGPSYFSASLENGGLLRSVNATTTTFQGNVVGILDALGSQSYQGSYEDDNRFARFMRRISFGLTIKNTDTVAAGDADATDGGVSAAVREQIEEFNRRLEQYSVRVIVGRNRRDPRDEDNRTALARLMANQGQDVLAAFEDALEDLQISTEYDDWITQSVRELKVVPLPFLAGALVNRLNLLCELAEKLDSNFQAEALRAYQAYAAFTSARSTVLENIEKRTLFAVEYVGVRQTPQTSTVRFIAEAQKGRWDLTMNASITGYDQQPAGVSDWYRDLQVAAEAARPFGNRFSRGQPGNGLGNPVLSFGFLYERLSNAATVTFGGRSLTAPAGNLYIGQLRLTLPMSNSGVKLPLSVSWSNRTELLDEAQVRANIGFTFNFDAVASLLKR
jgi:hypothetical protein